MLYVAYMRNTHALFCKRDVKSHQARDLSITGTREGCKQDAASFALRVSDFRCVYWNMNMGFLDYESIQVQNATRSYKLVVTRLCWRRIRASGLMGEPGAIEPSGR